MKQRLYRVRENRNQTVKVELMSKAPTIRFSDRVENYVRYRPGYPPEVMQLLRDECGLTAESVIADIASGTGIFTKMFLDNGNSVFAVEPNLEMREKADQLLAHYDRLVSATGSAEQTTLPPASVDFVTAAQAAHWFDLQKTRAEFVRILKPRGWCVLVWNERATDSTPFLCDYEELLLAHGTDYREVRHERTTEIIPEFFAPMQCKERTFELRQQFDYAGLAGRLLSSSYAPLPGHPHHEPMMAQLQKVFAAHARDEKVEFEYKTRVFYGRLTNGD